MKFIKLFSLLVFLFVCSTSATAQSEKLMAKSMEKVEKLNAKIIAGNAEMALNEEQKKEIQKLYADMTMQIRKVKKSGAADLEEQKKAIRKTTNKAINQQLTKEQRMAKKAGKEKLKG